ncbi:hypothetical protein M407DRAFT_24465 [Tulasnella calospora MUT 4182]|uniref:Protein transport protein sec16 n=1 Tax=Tulasnella calospora MUT 4182 TaxID=1051891 RepID=A0A0C3Q8R2_9AGAM|nr:hypothetical protein M407DRAFT_24465 [Tulasnella calospora MUT 4182]
MGTYDYNGQDYAHDTANGYSYGEHDGYANYDANGLHQNYATSNASQTATTNYYPTYPSYDPPGQAAASAQYPTYPSSVSSDPYQPATTTYSQQQQSYDPYAPTTTSAYTPSGSLSTAPTSSTQSASSTHSATTSSRGLYPGVTYATDSSYDPYKPTGNAKAPPPTKPAVQAAPTTPYTPSYPSYPSYPAYSTPEAPPRPKPTQTAAEVYRSTSYNAYDPPILDRPRKAKAGHGSILSPPPSASVPNYPAGPPPMGGRRTPVAPPPPPPRAQSPYYPAPAAPVHPPVQMAPVQPAYVPHQTQPPQQAHNLGGLYGPPPSNVQPPARPYSAQAPQQIAHTTGGSQPGWDATTNLQTNGAINLEEDWYADEFPKDEPQALPQTQRAEISLDPEDAQTPHYDPYREEVGSELGRRSLDAYEPHGVDSFAAHKPAPAASTVEQHSAYDPYAPPRKASLTSISSHGSATKPVHGSQPVGSTSPTMSAKSPRSVSGSVPTSPQDRHQVNGASPPVRYHQSSPTKAPPPPRTGTPGSVRSGIASPELSLKGRASPRPDAIIASEKIRAASPAAHLEAARSRIVHPETSAVKPPPTKVSPTHGTSPYDPYKPRSGTLPSSERPGFTQLGGMIPRTASPYTAEPTDGGQTTSYDPYSPQSNGHARRHTSESISSAQYNPYGVSAVPAESVYTPRASMESTYSSSYLPSSTQTGGDDPLGRTNCRAPIITFGFGGKVVSSFAKQINGSAGFDVSLVSRRPPPVSVRPLKSIMMEEAPKFPGPLFSDPGTPTVNITRTAATTVKAKKALVLKYLEERAAEVEAEIGQLAPEVRSQRAGKLSLILVLKVMVENDGKVSGSPEIEKAVRTALLPRLKDALDTSTFGFTSPAGNGLLVPGNPALSHTSAGDDRPLATYTVRSSVLDTIQEHLMRGEKRMAYRHALDERLWAHAMLIASSLDQDAWKETVGEFVRTELGVDPTRASSEPANGREALRVAYSLFAGHGASAVNELLPPKPLARTTNLNHSLIIPPSPLPPLTPAAVATGSYTVPHGPAPTESLAKWQEAAATIASNVSNGDTAALTALGDLLSANKWANAAHACYLLSLQTSHLGGAGSPASKVILVGSENPLLKPNFHVEDDPFIFSEVLEFAFSLVPTVKGQDAFNGIPHLQAYRLVQAFRLAEHGHISLATRYCDAIATTIRIGKPSPFYTTTFLEQLKDLSDRLSGTPQLDKTGSWIARKMTKPSLATLGNWIESGVTKFIAGEGDESASDPNSTKKPSGGAAAGPFAQFTVISSANTSPNASSANLSTMASPPMTGLAPPSTGPPRRTGSAMAVRGPFGMYGGLAPPDRASSAMDMRADPLSPMTPAGFQVLSANAATTFYEADSAYRGAADHAAASSMSASQSTDTERPSYGSWYDSGSQGDDASKNTSAATFYSVPAEGDAGGFMSPMDSFSGGPTSRTTSHHSTPRSMSVAPVEEEDEEDLGFGNSSRKKKQASKAEDGDAEEKKESKPAEKPAAPPPTPSSKPASPTEAKANGGGSWLPWKWGKKEEPSTPGPVKAKLGEESTFYYDKELKRWVNKKAGETSAAPAPLPPPPSRAPSRAQTASPSQMAPTTTSSLSRGATPPPRPQSSALASASTLKPLTSVVPPRRSHLAESYVPSPETSTPPTPSTDGGPTRSRIIDPDLVPPPSRASNSSKRKGKSRYIDVFQQEQGGAAS